MCQEFNLQLFFVILKELNYFFGICVVQTKTTTHLIVGGSGGYLPSCKANNCKELFCFSEKN